MMCGLLSSCGVQVFSSLVVLRGLQGAWAPGRMGSVVCSTWALSLRRASSVVVACRLSCPVACGILVPQPGIEPTSSALEGGFFTIGPRGKSLICFLNTSINSYFGILVCLHCLVSSVGLLLLFLFFRLVICHMVMPLQVTSNSDCVLDIVYKRTEEVLDNGIFHRRVLNIFLSGSDRIADIKLGQC